MSVSIQSSPETPSHRAPRKPRKPWKWVLLLVCGGLAIYLAASFIRKDPAGRGGEGGDRAPIQTVAVEKVTRADLSQALTLAAEFHPYQEVSIHAKVAGYVQVINVDIGDHVKAGGALAVLEVPELKDELGKAAAQVKVSEEDVKRAEANFQETHAIYARLMEVSKEHPKLVAQGDVDTAKSKDDAMSSALGSAREHVTECQAERERLAAMLDYATIRAPFDGVITRRYADVGALVQAGTSSAQAGPVVDFAEDDILATPISCPRIGSPAYQDRPSCQGHGASFE